MRKRFLRTLLEIVNGVPQLKVRIHKHTFIRERCLHAHGAIQHINVHCGNYMYVHRREQVLVYTLERQLTDTESTLWKL